MTLPLVSVIIPVYGRSNLVLRLMSSLRNQVRVGEIILVDDKSPENDREVLQTIEGVRYFRHNANEGFIKSTAHGVGKAQYPYLLILNSDTEAYHTHCIEEMAKNLDDGAAVCGALLLYPKNDPRRPEAIQHCGVYFDARHGYPQHIMSGMPSNTPMAQVRRRVPAVTGACFMVKRDWWEKLGGWDNRLEPAVFEDVEFCIRTTKLKGEIIYEPKSMWTHYEHQSQEQGGGWFTQEHLSRNFQYLIAKHGQQPPSDEYWFKGLA